MRFIYNIGLKIYLCWSYASYTFKITNTKIYSLLLTINSIGNNYIVPQHKENLHLKKLIPGFPLFFLFGQFQVVSE